MSESERAFINFMSKYHRSYQTKEEYQYRLSIFQQNFNFAKNHKSTNYKVGINKFSDISADEWAKRSAKTPEPVDYPENHLSQTTKFDRDTVPASLDWREKGVISPVKDMGTCFAPWAFGSIEAIESANAMTTGNMILLSVQQPIDCLNNQQLEYGCSGGEIENCLIYAMSTAIQTDEQYPFTMKTGTTCQQEAGAVMLKNFTQLFPRQDSDVLFQVIQTQPIIVLVDTTSQIFQSYTSGIIDSDDCGQKLATAMLIVGYGTDATTAVDYWIVKPAYGSDWGEEGYVRIARSTGFGAGGVCGIANWADLANM